ncbi:hypothetical protein QR680_014669 [Steinernema hermaphroditum]|uniref:Uncharacterized protein n=1 Tax=Steinernema hermaphroditum TaxID=289476 RepID=A0AA39I9R7_9BILA|nr:hypothetical protein QR680_014669 [Steinernema hermaphroditum]
MSADTNNNSTVDAALRAILSVLTDPGKAFTIFVLILMLPIVLPLLPMLVRLLIRSYTFAARKCRRTARN